MKIRVWNNRKRIWYMLCFVLLGIIDQRRGSAKGEIQLLFSNLTGIIMAMMVIPSLHFQKFKQRIYFIWTPICTLFTVILCWVGTQHVVYKGQWIAAILSLAVWSYIIVYILKERTHLEVRERLKQPYFWCMFLLLCLMQLSVHEGIIAIWYFIIYGSFYAIGIERCDYDSFFLGMTDGILIWFALQQIVAFALRPYDYVRYRGLYSGETQNGLFYMIVYCAVLIKLIYNKKNNSKIFFRFFYFVMLAICIDFIIFTGGRAPLLGVVIVTLGSLLWYEIVREQSFYKFMVRGIALCLCVIFLFPTVYCSIRYIPTILHHPIWFEGEYRENESIRSFDAWDSDRYISLEKVFDKNIARILNAVGINYKSLKEKMLFHITVYGKELEEPGKTANNPYILEGTDSSSSISVRKTIYSYFFRHLNLRGHKKEEAGFYFSSDMYYGHAHNMFLQVAYDYGVLAGLLYLGIYVYSIYAALRMNGWEKFAVLIYLIAILTFGMMEMVLVPGQITIPIIVFSLYFVGKESKNCKSTHFCKSVSDF